MVGEEKEQKKRGGNREGTRRREGLEVIDDSICNHKQNNLSSVLWYWDKEGVVGEEKNRRGGEGTEKGLGWWRDWKS